MRYSIIHHDVRERFELTISQYLVADSVHQLSRKGVCTQPDAEIASFLGLSRQHVNESKAALLKKGLIEKIGQAFTTTQKWHSAVTYKSVVKSDTRGEVSENTADLSENTTTDIIYKDNKNSVDKSTHLPHRIVSDTQEVKKIKKNQVAWALREKLYDMFLKENGHYPSRNQGDYHRVVAALKKLTEKQIIDLVEDALSDGRKKTVREMLTDRSIDVYLQDS